MRFSALRFLGVAASCVLYGFALPREAAGQESECPVDCDQKYEAGQVQHRLNEDGGQGWTVGPEMHTAWYVNSCSVDHECEPNFLALELARGAVAAHNVKLLALLTARTPSLEIDATRNVLQLLNCRGAVVAQIPISRSLVGDLLPHAVGYSRPTASEWTLERMPFEPEF